MARMVWSGARSKFRSSPRAKASGRTKGRPSRPMGKIRPPPLPTELLPTPIKEYTLARTKLMGCDPAAIAMSALTVCATVIPDVIQLQVKRHDPKWRESTRIWTGLVGLPSTMKSPPMLEAVEPLRQIDKRQLARYLEAMKTYENLS